MLVLLLKYTNFGQSLREGLQWKSFLELPEREMLKRLERKARPKGTRPKTKNASKSMNAFFYCFLVFYFMLADKYSLFILAMFSNEIPFGHSTSHAPVLVQFPNPSSSIWRTMFNTRAVASTFPCGNKAY